MDFSQQVKLSEIRMKQREMRLKENEFRLRAADQEHRHKREIQEMANRVAQEQKDFNLRVANKALEMAFLAKVGSDAKSTDNTKFVENVHETWKSLIGMTGQPLVDTNQNNLVS